MQREIKFRGKRYDTGEWVYGDLLRGKNITWIVVDAKEALYPSSTTEGGMSQTQRQNLFRVDPGTVGQADSFRGQEYFDGDVADFYRHSDSTNKHEFSFRSKIVFIKGAFRYWSDLTRAWLPVHGLWNPGESMKIIGNIHDNPELLHPEDMEKE